MFNQGFGKKRRVWSFGVGEKKEVGVFWFWGWVGVFWGRKGEYVFLGLGD